MTVGKFGIGCAFALALTLGANSGFAMGPVNVTGPSISRATLLDASFFGRPYPYGYTGWGPCVRYVEVETRWGLRVRRIWVCR
jgi:hypothetical protein